MEERIHPLFIREYTYFGYFQGHLPLHNFERVIEHNKGRDVEYFSSVEPCHVDTMVARILREKFPNEKIISPPSE